LHQTLASRAAYASRGGYNIGLDIVHCTYIERHFSLGEPFPFFFLKLRRKAGPETLLKEIPKVKKQQKHKLKTKENKEEGKEENHYFSYSLRWLSTL